MVKKRKRKMTPEQKQAAAERLAAARAARQSANPPEYKNIHESVLKREESDSLSLKSVRGWIKNTKERISAERQNLRLGDKGATARIASLEGYVRNLQAYLMHGDYIDMYWGENAEYRTKSVCIAPSYDRKGNIHRTVGVWYRDIGMVWTEDLDKAERALRG